jgi:hypothetical protein
MVIQLTEKVVRKIEAECFATGRTFDEIIGETIMALQTYGFMRQDDVPIVVLPEPTMICLN